MSRHPSSDFIVKYQLDYLTHSLREVPRLQHYEKMRRLRHLLGTLALGLFAMAAPFVLVGAVIVEQLSTENDTVWLLKVVCTVLMPFAAVLWYIVISYLRRRRAGYLMQLMVFFGTAFVMYALLALGVYSIRL